MKPKWWGWVRCIINIEIEQPFIMEQGSRENDVSVITVRWRTTISNVIDNYEPECSDNFEVKDQKKDWNTKWWRDVVTIN